MKFGYVVVYVNSSDKLLDKVRNAFNSESKSLRVTRNQTFLRSEFFIPEAMFLVRSDPADMDQNSSLFSPFVESV